ncbi:phosphoadenylyl-sulfate reductase [Candidatus Parcubacteria bacterium]|nr:MAG: phosphoadenylyl-sulfate reductase [Candidatus Parcubacteria bacterium]
MQRVGTLYFAHYRTYLLLFSQPSTSRHSVSLLLDMISNLDLLNETFAKAHPTTILRWAWDTFAPEIVATSSFQTQSVPLLHLIAQTVPALPVLFVDTGFHFPETLIYRDRLEKELGLAVKVVKPKQEHSAFLRTYGELYRRDPDMCCYVNKVEPLQRALQGVQAWITGIRRDQTSDRKRLRIVTRLDSGVYKICPMANWSRRDIWRYISAHHLPEHPLIADGYLSIGCAPCTRPITADEGEREGRWPGQSKSECGLHTIMMSSAIPADEGEA